MKLIKPSYEILTPISENAETELKFIEQIARTCYKSQGNNHEAMIRSLIKNGHHAMLEHSILTVKFIVDRGITHELVRHRESSFAQESTRYCNYSNEKFGNELTFIEPFWYDGASYNDKKIFEEYCANVERTYMYFIDSGHTPQEDRAVLPNCIKSEIVLTANYREWRHIFSLRAANTTGKAHPDMNAIMCPLLQEIKSKIPVIFDDVYETMLEDNQAVKFLAK